MHGIWFEFLGGRQMISKIELEKVMTMIRIVMIMFFATMVNVFAQTTYYVSYSEGNDNNSGTSSQSPWKSISKLNNTTFQPGDQILFKRNDKWENSEGLLITSSGTSNNRIIFGAYGEGNKPIISLMSEVAGWNNAGNWISYSTNVWYMVFPNVPLGSGVEGISRMWFNGVEYPRARGLGSSNLDQLSGEPETFGVNAKHRYHHQVYSSEPRLYVYTDGSNPASYYTSMKYCGYYDPLLGTVLHTIDLRNADYITIEDLDIRGGMYSPILLSGSDYILIDNCNIGPSQHAGIIADGQQTSDKTSDYVEVKNCILDSQRKVKVNFYDGGVEYGLTTNNANYWNIHNNIIKNWSFGYLPLAGYGNSTGQRFYNNDISAPDIEYGKGIQFGGDGEPFKNFGHEVYNNDFHDLKISGINLNSNVSQRLSNLKFYNNLFRNITKSENEHADQENSGFGISGVADSIFIFNNTFYNINFYALFTWDCKNAVVHNNLIVNVNKVFPSHLALTIGQFQIGSYYNNLLYYNNFTTSNQLVAIDGSGGYTIPQFNNSPLNSGRILTGGNLQGIGALNNLMNTSDFTLPSNSLGIEAGRDISQLVPAGFRDRMGYLVDRIKPAIGAIQNTSALDVTPPQLVSAILIDAEKLQLTFSEPLNPNDIPILSNYQVTNGIQIYSAQAGSSQSMVILNTSSHVYAQNYTVIISNVRDLSGNVIQSANNSASYYCSFNPPPIYEPVKLTIFRATASSSIGVNYGADKTIDGKYFSNGGDTCWAAVPLPQWVIYDLGTSKPISRTKISFYDFQNGRVNNYSIYISNDLLNWNNILPNGTSSNQEWAIDNFDPITARFVKFEVTSNNQNNYAVVWETEIWGSDSSFSSALDAKVILQGAYENGIMSTTLQNSGDLPLHQPYNISPWNYDGNETVQNIPPNIVDWVLIELRSDTAASTTVVKQAALLKKDGSIVGLDGISSLNFVGYNSSYYAVIHHRNHLSIMSSQKLSFQGSSVNYDFTASPSTVFGNELCDLGDGKYAMFAGDSDANGIINVLDYSAVGNNLFQVGYKQGDLDLNHIINILDYGMTNKNLMKFSKVPGAVILE